MIRHLYTLLLYLLFPLVLLRLLWRSIKAPDYRQALAGAAGYFSDTGRPGEGFGFTQSRWARYRRSCP